MHLIDSVHPWFEIISSLYDYIVFKSATLIPFLGGLVRNMMA